MGQIAWIDLETTGTDEFDDPIIEAAVVITTDRHLTEVARRNWVIEPRRGVGVTLDRIRANQPVLDMHTNNGLLADLKSGEGLTDHATAQAEIVAFIKKFHSGGGRIPLGGSGVSHFDRRFIAAQMPVLSDILTYWAFDIGSVRRFGGLCGIKAPEEASDAAAKTHRAMDDVLMHVEEARWWIRFLRSMKAEGVVRDLKREDAHS